MNLNVALVRRHPLLSNLEHNYEQVLRKLMIFFFPISFCRGFQRAMVKSMSLAAKVPHFHYVDEINCNALVGLKSSFQKNNPYPDVKHTFLPILIKSLSMALLKYPFVNSCFKEDAMEVVLKGLFLIHNLIYDSYKLAVLLKVDCVSIFCGLNIRFFISKKDMNSRKKQQFSPKLW